MQLIKREVVYGVSRIEFYEAGAADAAINALIRRMDQSIALRRDIGDQWEADDLLAWRNDLAKIFGIAVITREQA